MHPNTIKKNEAAYAEKFAPPKSITECAVYNALRLHQSRSRQLESVGRFNQESTTWGSVPQLQPMNWREKQKFLRRKHLEGYLRPALLKESTSLLPISVPSQPLSQVQKYLDRRRSTKQTDAGSKPPEAATATTFKVRPYLKSLYEPLTIGDEQVGTDSAADADMPDAPTSSSLLSDTITHSMSSLQTFLHQIDTANAKYESHIVTDVQQTMATEKELLKNLRVQNLIASYSSPALAAIATVAPSPKRKYNKAPKPGVIPATPSTPTPSTPKKRGYEEISLREAEAASEQEERNLQLEIMNMQRQNLLQSRASNLSSASPIQSSPSASPLPAADADVHRSARIEQRDDGDVLIISIKRPGAAAASPSSPSQTAASSSSGGGRYSSRVRTSAGTQVFCEVCSGPIDNVSSKCPRCRYDPLKNQDPEARRKLYEDKQQEKRREQQQEAQQSGRMQAIAQNMTPW